MEEDSIDLIDTELRKLLETRPSDFANGRSPQINFESRQPAEQPKEFGLEEDKFSDLMERMEHALAGSSSKKVSFSPQKQEMNKFGKIAANLNLAAEEERVIPEKRKTLVWPAKPVESVEIESTQINLHKARTNKKWGVIEGRRVLGKFNGNIHQGQKVDQTQSHSASQADKEIENDRFLELLKNDAKHNELLTIPKAESNKKEWTKKIVEQNAVKKPKLSAEESYLGYENSLQRSRSKAKQQAQSRIDSKMRQIEENKPLKPIDCNMSFSSIIKVQEKSPEKSGDDKFFLGFDKSNSKILNKSQQKELQSHLADMKICEFKNKLEYLLNKNRPKDGLVFFKLIADILKDYAQHRSTLLESEAASPVVKVMDKLAEKMKELDRLVNTLNLKEDSKLAGSLVDNISANIELVLITIEPKRLSGITKGLSPELQSPEKALKNEKKEIQKKANDDKKDEELNLCVKKNIENDLKPQQNPTAKLDFDEVILAEPRTWDETQNKLNKNQMIKQRPPNNFEQNHRRRESSKGNSMVNEAEMIVSQRFGCRIFCTKLMGKKLVCGFEDGTLSLFSINRTEGLSLEKSGKLHPRPISSISCTFPEQRRGLIFTGYTGTSSCSIVVWDASSLKPLKELCGHTATVSCLDYIQPNYLISSSFDRKTIFWDLDECEAVLSSEAHQTPVLCSYYDSDTLCLYTGSLDGSIVISGLVMDEGELTDLKIFKKIAGSGPILHLSACLDDKLLSLQNSRLVVYDSRGVQCKEIKSQSMVTTSVYMLNQEICLLIDPNGRPHLQDLVNMIEKRREYGQGGGILADKSSLLLASRLTGANCKAQLYFEGSVPFIISANEKLDALSLYKIK